MPNEINTKYRVELNRRNKKEEKRMREEVIMNSKN